MRAGAGEASDVDTGYMSETTIELEHTRKDHGETSLNPVDTTGLWRHLETRAFSVSRGAWVLVPYVVGALNFTLFNVLYRIERGTFWGGDTSEFMWIADALRSGALFTSAHNAKPIGYPILLVLSASLPGGTVRNALIFNALFYLLTIYMVGRIGRLLNFSPIVTLVAQTGFAMVSNPVLWANLVLSDTMAMVLFVSSFRNHLEMELAPSKEVRIGRGMLLGLLVGALTITRTEYVLLFPIVTVVLFRWILLRGWAERHVLITIAVVWVFGLPLLLVQPLVTGWKGPASFVPPKQSGLVGIWASQYDFEFTQYRIHRLYEIAEEVIGTPDIDLTPVKTRIQQLKYNYANAAPIDDRVLEEAFNDVRKIRDLAATRGLSRVDVYRELALELLAENPWRVVSRAIKRFGLFVTAANLDWPQSELVYWVYTIQLRPLSTLAYAFVVILLAVNQMYSRWTMAVIGLWMAFPITVHSGFVMEQRYLYPSIPLLCVVWGQALQALLAWQRVLRPVAQR